MKENSSILVVDDEKIVRESLYSWLMEDGYTVDISENGERAIDIMNSENYDLALVDVHMPGIDGIELLKQIKTNNRNMPVLIMTAYASMDSAFRAMRCGAYDYIIKPFNPETVSQMIRRALEFETSAKENSGVVPAYV